MPIDAAAHLLIKPLAFTIAALPLVVLNLRTGNIPNWANAVLLGAGLAILALAGTLAPSPWILMALAPIILFALKILPGGAAKFLIALLPWFTPGEYLFVTGAGFLLVGLIGKFRGDASVQIATPMSAIGLLVLAANAALTHAH
jgi:hypothetical protein